MNNIDIKTATWFYMAIIRATVMAPWLWSNIIKCKPLDSHAISISRITPVEGCPDRIAQSVMLLRKKRKRCFNSSS